MFRTAGINNATLEHQVKAKAHYVKASMNDAGLIVPMLTPEIQQWSTLNDAPLILTLNDQGQTVVATDSEDNLTLFTLAF